MFHFDADAFSRLADSFYHLVVKVIFPNSHYCWIVKGQNEDELFLTTNPKELDSFRAFLRGISLPFDCVVDLPNYLHTVSNRKLSTLSVEAQTDLLSNVRELLHFYNICVPYLAVIFTSSNLSFQSHLSSWKREEYCEEKAFLECC